MAIKEYVETNWILPPITGVTIKHEGQNYASKYNLPEKTGVYWWFTLSNTAPAWVLESTQPFAFLFDINEIHFVDSLEDLPAMVGQYPNLKVALCS